MAQEEKEDKVVDTNVIKHDDGTVEATVTRESGATGVGVDAEGVIDKPDARDAIGDAVEDSK